MKSDFIKIHIKDKKFVNINLRGIEKYFNYDDLAFLKKNINWMIGITVGRIPANTKGRKKFLQPERLRNENKYAEIYLKFLDWYFNIYSKQFKGYRTRNYLDIELSRRNINFNNTQGYKKFFIEEVPFIDESISENNFELSNIKCVKCMQPIPQKKTRFV